MGFDPDEPPMGRPEGWPGAQKKRKEPREYRGRRRATQRDPRSPRGPREKPFAPRKKERQVSPRDIVPSAPSTHKAYAVMVLSKEMGALIGMGIFSSPEPTPQSHDIFTSLVKVSNGSSYEDAANRLIREIKTDPDFRWLRLSKGTKASFKQCWWTPKGNGY